MKSKIFTNNFKKKCENEIAIDNNVIEERNRGRREKREVDLYNNISNINTEDWYGLKSIIRVKREVEDKKGLRKEVVYYISSLDSNKVTAKEFNIGIRSHWFIENSLHYVKDVTFKEDSSKIISGNAPQNMSLIRNIAINILRKFGHTNIARAIRLITNDIKLLYSMILE